MSQSGVKTYLPTIYLINTSINVIKMFTSKLICMLMS